MNRLIKREPPPESARGGCIRETGPAEHQARVLVSRAQWRNGRWASHVVAASVCPKDSRTTSLDPVGAGLYPRRLFRDNPPFLYSRSESLFVKVPKILLSLPFALAVSASCLAKAEVGIGELKTNPRAYEGKQVTLQCLIRSADLGSVYCGQGDNSISLSSKTMDKSSLKFALAHCSKPKESDNDPRCQNVTVTAKLKDATRPGWLDNAKLKFKTK